MAECRNTFRLCAGRKNHEKIPRRDNQQETKYEWYNIALAEKTLVQAHTARKNQEKTMFLRVVRKNQEKSGKCIEKSRKSQELLSFIRMD